MIQMKPGGRIVCAGDMTPDIHIPYGETISALSKIRDGNVETSNPTLHPGGAVSNTVAALGNLGMHPTMLSVVGNDEYGDFLIDDLKQCGVCTSYISKQKERMSLILAVIDETGERVLYLFDGPGAHLPELSEETLPEELIPEISWFHANGFATDATVGYMERCREAGAIVSFDLNLRCETFGFDAERRARIQRAVAASHVVFGSGTEEFTPLTGYKDLEEAAVSLAHSGRIVVARNGSEPVILAEGASIHKIPVQKTNVVNKIGAGDSFNGGFIAACAEGYAPQDAVIWGNICASSVISNKVPRQVPHKEIVAKIAKERTGL